MTPRRKSALPLPALRWLCELEKPHAHPHRHAWQLLLLILLTAACNPGPLRIAVLMPRPHSPGERPP